MSNEEKTIEVIEEKTDKAIEEREMDKQELAKKTLEDIKKKSRESLEAMREGKGRLRLETPIKHGEKLVEELPYDFMGLTGVEYTLAMDSDPNARDAYRITYRQALALFAAAAAKHVECLDSRDIVEKIGITDAVEGAQLATSFFAASTRAGRLRISKK